MNKIFLFLFILLCNSVLAQNNSGNCNCCSKENRQFDFWIGDWQVFNKLGVNVGENKIVVLQDSCLLQENWISNGQTGTSYNFYDNTDSTWNQVYIDNLGTVLNLKGHFLEEKMVLKSQKIKGDKKDYFNRIIWSMDSLGNVNQKWDIIDEEDNVLSIVFDGIYKKKLSLSKIESMKKVTGIGGIFFKCNDPIKMKEWYKTHLGFDTDEYGTTFEWRQAGDSTKRGFTQWSPFSQTTKYFEPAQKEFMINYRVENLELLVEQLEKEGVTIVDKIETFDYGKFVHIMDMEGNKIELWEPYDLEYEKIVGGVTK